MKEGKLPVVGIISLFLLFVDVDVDLINLINPEETVINTTVLWRGHNAIRYRLYDRQVLMFLTIEDPKRP